MRCWAPWFGFLTRSHPADLGLPRCTLSALTWRLVGCSLTNPSVGGGPYEVSSLLPPFQARLHPPTHSHHRPQLTSAPTTRMRWWCRPLCPGGKRPPHPSHAGTPQVICQMGPCQYCCWETFCGEGDNRTHSPAVSASFSFMLLVCFKNYQALCWDNLVPAEMPPSPLGELGVHPAPCLAL